MFILTIKETRYKLEIWHVHQFSVNSLDQVDALANELVSKRVRHLIFGPKQAMNLKVVEDRNILICLFKVGERNKVK